MLTRSNRQFLNNESSKVELLTCSLTNDHKENKSPTIANSILSPYLSALDFWHSIVWNIKFETLKIWSNLTLSVYRRKKNQIHQTQGFKLENFKNQLLIDRGNIFFFLNWYWLKVWMLQLLIIITAAMSLTNCVALLVLHVYKYIHSAECYKTLTSKVFL